MIVLSFKNSTVIFVADSYSIILHSNPQFIILFKPIRSFLCLTILGKFLFTILPFLKSEYVLFFTSYPSVNCTEIFFALIYSIISHSIPHFIILFS